MSKRRAWRGVLALAALCCVVSAADLPGKWRAWRYSRAVLQEAGSAGGPAELQLPWDIFAHCAADCADLRIIDARSQEVPYELVTERPVIRSQSYAARIVENSFVPGKYTQVVGEIALGDLPYDRVRVETGESDFIVWAEVALSDDAKLWRVVEPRAPIARFRRRSVEGTQTVAFQGLSSRYVRVRIFEPLRQFTVNGLTVLNQESRPGELDEVPATFAAARSEDAAESAWISNLASSRLPVSRVRFATGTEEFYRAVQISSSVDGKLWSYRGSGTIYRYKLGDQVRKSLAIDFPEWREHTILRVSVVNGDDRPLANVSLSLFAVPRKIVFRRQSGGAYRGIYGNERAAAPQYDLAHYFNVGADKPVYAVLALGPEELTSNYLDPRPFSERHPEVLWIALGIAIVLIGLTAVKTLRTSGRGRHTNQA